MSGSYEIMKCECVILVILLKSGFRHPRGSITHSGCSFARFTVLTLEKKAEMNPIIFGYALF